MGPSVSQSFEFDRRRDVSTVCCHEWPVGPRPTLRSHRNWPTVVRAVYRLELTFEVVRIEW